ncbi:uroporphyrinogen-III C-methyltransferase [Oceanospirillum sediminis]|uniref:Uroporphyrinogen-III C-methyltransferase n=1 Tax=Oceanospirillum sediminis TaxID=2760088 RepID=A0A839IP23_9GAMM|nr:uroporphyrinogen-III C-methyltransferase [Oceanospirillum sediminis]MBB1486434.1 uroporphyrinogen-III C-methyltransferase [Oceanospirillum sediminis]
MSEKKNSKGPADKNSPDEKTVTSENQSQKEQSTQPSADQTTAANTAEQKEGNQPDLKGKADNSKPASAQPSAVDKKASDEKNPADPKAADKKATTQADPKAQPAEEKQASGKGLATLAILISLGAAGAAGYGLWMQQTKLQQQLQELSDSNSALTSKVQQQNGQISSFSSLKQLPASIQKLDGEQSKQRQQMIQLAAELADARGPKPSDWLQAEAEYLLRLANHRLQLEGDINGAEAMLASADERLMEADDPSLFAVREAIADERLSLSGLAPVDKSGMFFTIAALENQIDQLPLPLEPGNTSDVSKGLNLKGEEGTPIWKTLWSEMKGLVIIRHRDETITPLLPPQESMYLRHNLRLNLQQAQIALMKEDTRLYKALMQQAQQWIKSHFDLNQHMTQNALKQLAKLESTSIEVKKPDVSGSLKLLRKIQKQRFKPQRKEPQA